MKALTPPTTGYVRASYSREKHPEIPDLIELRGEGFDLWLAAEKAAAWSEGRAAAYEEFEKDPRGLWFHAANPYIVTA